MVNVQEGSLDLSGGGNLSGTALTGDVQLSAGTFTLDNVTGSGQLLVTGSITIPANGNINKLTISGGALTEDGALSVGNLTLAGGVLTGSGTVTVGGTFTWTGGAMSGSGK